MTKPDQIPPLPGQESVWNYPRPPRLEASDRHVLVCIGDVRIANSFRAFRILERSHPPTYYIPPTDIAMERLQPSSFTTVCEWKGHAYYYDVIVNETQVLRAAWSYHQPRKPYESIADHLAFYPHKLGCYLDGERVQPQAGGFYGGWITADIEGPFKGGPGTEAW